MAWGKSLRAWNKLEACFPIPQQEPWGHETFYYNPYSLASWSVPSPRQRLRVHPRPRSPISPVLVDTEPSPPQGLCMAPPCTPQTSAWPARCSGPLRDASGFPGCVYSPPLLRVCPLSQVAIMVHEFTCSQFCRLSSTTGWSAAARGQPPVCAPLIPHAWNRVCHMLGTKNIC